MGYLPQLTVFANAGKGHEEIPLETIAGLQQETDEGGTTYYLIYDKDDLELFRDIVNGNPTEVQKLLYPEGASANGRLEADIDLNPGITFNADGNYTENTTPEQWTPIGGSIRYAGTFDGGGHTVSGVYINNTSNNQGLFGYVDSSGTVQNLGVINSYIRADDYVGGIVGIAHGSSGNHAEVKNCFSTATVIGTDERACAGGITGQAAYANIENCYNTGTVSGGKDARVGGIVGFNNRGIIKNCYSTGMVSSVESAYVGGVAGLVSNGTVTNCYYLDTCGKSDMGTAVTIAQIEDTGENGLLAKLADGSGEGVWNTTLSAVGSWEYGKPVMQPCCRRPGRRPSRIPPPISLPFLKRQKWAARTAFP